VHFFAWRLGGNLAAAFQDPTPHLPNFSLQSLDPIGFLTSLGLWLGLAFAAACVAGAVWLRRRREPI
jgi:predicted outer membrane lipoprotein